MRLQAIVVLAAMCISVPAKSQDAGNASRILAAVMVHLSYCPTLKPGPGIDRFMKANKLLLRDISEGGKFFEIAVEHARFLKLAKQVAGQDNADHACPKAMELYGPSGEFGKGLVVPR